VDGEQKLKGCFQFQSAAGKSISVSSYVPGEHRGDAATAGTENKHA